MGGAAGSGDDDFDAAFFGVGSVLEKQVGGAVGGDDACFMWNAEGFERFGDELHGVPVGAGAHDDADEGVGDYSLSIGCWALRFCFHSDCVCRSFKASL